MTKAKLSELTTTALLAVVILISGLFKIPSPVAGGEFQLSAPIAVLICACFGFKRYFCAGILASLLTLLLGTGNLLSVVVQLCFRLVAGGVLALGGTNLVTLAVSGPLGTFCARLALWQLTGVSWQLLAAAAAPGMLFTAVCSLLAYKPALRLLQVVRLAPASAKE